MTLRTPRPIALAAALAVASLALPARAQTTKPAGDAMPATQPAGQAQDAKPMIDQMAAAYGDLKSLQLAGTVTADFDVAGQKQNKATPFTGAFKAPNEFRHDVPEEITVVSDGKTAYIYGVKENKYLKVDAPTGKQAVADLPVPLPGLLQQQDISLLLALVKDPGAFLTEGGVAATAGQPEQIDGTSYPVISVVGQGTNIKLALDPDTHLVRRMTVDLADSMKQRGAPAVNKATITLDYTTSKPGADVADATFSFTPPAGATEFQTPAANAGEGQDPSAALEGKPAPDFSLQTLDGKTVKLSDLKGSVVVLDMWATWCPPCREGLPHLDETYQAMKADGLKAFAVNVREEKAQVQGFVDQTKLKVPVLLDAEGKVSDAYMANAIPETIVIGKDGVVKKVIVGLNPEGVTSAIKEVMGK